MVADNSIEELKSMNLAESKTVICENLAGKVPEHLNWKYQGLVGAPEVKQLLKEMVNDALLSFFFVSQNLKTNKKTNKKNKNKT